MSYRKLRPAEQNLAIQVFGSSLPSFDYVYANDGTGAGNAAFTDDMAIQGYVIHVGKRAYGNLASTQIWNPKNPQSTTRVCDLFIHEMTHVWQYYHSYMPKIGRIAIWVADLFSSKDRYAYTLGESWDRYNTEQQASIVEDWFSRQMKATDKAYPYIKHIIRKGTSAANTRVFLSLAELNKL